MRNVSSKGHTVEHAIVRVTWLSEGSMVMSIVAACTSRDAAFAAGRLLADEHGCYLPEDA